MAARTWDIFCKLLDNFGDVGVSWRLAADLASRGERVRLWVDDRSPLQFMAPTGCDGVTVFDWPAEGSPAEAALDWPLPGEVVIETFGCELPQRFVQAMAAKLPVWLNLEYLSAEDYVERSHTLLSPQRSGAAKWFFYPGFTPATGGLIREAGLMDRRALFDRDAWLGGYGIHRKAEERVALLFCYPNPALASTLQRLCGPSQPPALLLLTPGHATEQVQAVQAAGALPPRLRLATLPWLSQREFDHALWSADINFIRGEDSWVRAIWAGTPFVWQLYPQEAEVLELKLQAWLQRMRGTQAPPHSAGVASAVERLHRQYNGLETCPETSQADWPSMAEWQATVARWRSELLAQSDLVCQLQGFVNGKS